MNSLLAQSINSLPSPTVILREALAIYRQRFSTFVGTMIIRELMMIFLIVALVLLARNYPPSLFLFFILFAILFVIAVFISQCWGEVALIYAIKDSEEKIGVIELYQWAWEKAISYSWLFLLRFLIIIFGFLLFLIPGIIFSVWFSFAGFVLINEDLKGLNALWRSREYVKGRWLSVFWRLFFISVLSLLISWVISWVVIFIFGFFRIPFLSEIGNLIAMIFLFPLSTAYNFLLYDKLRFLKEEKN